MQNFAIIELNFWNSIFCSNEVASLPYGCAVKRQASSTGVNGMGVGKLGKPEPVIEYLAFQELSKTGDNLSVGYYLFFLMVLLI